MRLWRRFISPPESLSLESRWPEELEIRIAETENDLEKAFRLLHTIYVSEGMISPQPSEMRILPQFLLPQTSVVIAFWQKRAVGAVTLVRDNPLGLPIEHTISLEKLRRGGKCLAEMSLLTTDPLEQALRSRVSFPLFRFIYQYARKCFGIETLLVESSHSSLKLYRDVLLFRRSHVGSLALELDLLQAPKNWNTDLTSYMAQEFDHPHCKLPGRVYGVVADLRLTPQILEKLYLRRAGLFNTLKRQEVRAIQDAYPHASFDSILKNLNWSPDDSPKREIRLDTLMTAKIVENEHELPIKLQVRNISRHGLQLWSEKAPRLNEVMILEVKLNDTQSTRLCAQVKWTDAAGHSGLRILSYSSEWSVMLQSIESQLAKLVSSK